MPLSALILAVKAVITEDGRGCIRERLIMQTVAILSACLVVQGLRCCFMADIVRHKCHGLFDRWRRPKKMFVIQAYEELEKSTS